MEAVKTTYLLFGLVLFTIGMLLFGEGLTSMVVSQSCCFPPDCPQEYLCDAAEPSFDVTGGERVLAGILLTGFALTVSVFGLRRRSNV